MKAHDARSQRQKTLLLLPASIFPSPSPLLFGIEFESAKLLQSCPTLCDLTDCSLPGSSIHGILQARIESEKDHSNLEFLNLGTTDI